MTALFGSLTGILFGLILYILNDLKKQMLALGGQLDNLRREFNDFRREVNARFEKVNDRFSELRKEFNDRFDNLEKRVSENAKAIGELKGMFMGMNIRAPTQETDLPQQTDAAEGAPPPVAISTDPNPREIEPAPEIQAARP